MHLPPQARAPTGATLVTTLKYNHRENPVQRRTETTKPLLITEKRRRPAQRAGTESLLIMNVVTKKFIAVSLLAGSPQYTLVSGPHGR